MTRLRAQPVGRMGIAIRYVREYEIQRDVQPPVTLDRVIFSCLTLGHTWRINVGEKICNVCGAPNPDVPQ